MFDLCALFRILLPTFLFIIHAGCEDLNLLVRLPRSLSLLSINLTKKTILNETTVIDDLSEEMLVFLASDAVRNLAYFSYRNMLRSATLDAPSMNEELFNIGGILDESITTIAYDWVNELMYIGFANSGPDTSARIEVCRVNKPFKKCAVVLHSNLDYVHHLVLDPKDGYMYWLNGISHKIERSFMNGDHHDRHPFQDSTSFAPHVSPVSSLTLHEETRSLYYVRSPNEMSEIWQCELYKRDSCSIVARSPRIMYFTVSQEFFIWSTTSAVLMACKSIDCERSQGAITGISQVELLIPIGQHYQTERIDSNPCQENNGGCSDYCLLVHFEPWSKCACEKGVKILEDHKTCNPQGIDQVLLISSMSGLFFVSMDTPDRTPQPIAYSGYETESPTHKLYDVDWDPVERKVYWIDATSKAIRRADFSGENVEDLITVDVSASANVIRVDSYSRNIFWIDQQLDRLQIASIAGGYRRTLFSGGFRKTHGLAIDPFGGYLYFSEINDGFSLIVRVRMDGTERKPIIRLDESTWPNGLHIDLTEERLYWTESTHSIIRTSFVNGTNVQTFSDSSGKFLHPSSISKIGPHLFCNSMAGRSLMEFDLSTDTLENNLPAMFDIGIYGALGIRAISLQQKPLTASACAQNNGGCSHICIALPEGTRCLCQTGFELQPNNRTCTRPPAYLLLSGKESIERFSMSQSSLSERLDLPSLEFPVTAVYIHKETMIYVAAGSSERGIIARAPLNGSQWEVVINSSSLAGISGVTVDHWTNNIYWCSRLLRRIELSDPTGRYRRVIAWGDIRPSYIIVHASSRTLFFYDHQSYNSSIRRMNMSGDVSGGEIILTNFRGLVKGLALDSKNLQLFWTEITTDGSQILSSKLNGSQPEVLFASNLRRIARIFYHHYKLWWIDEKHKDVGFYEKRKVTVLHKNVPGTVDIQVVSTTGQEDSSNPSGCIRNNGGCSQICLSNTTGFVTCTCSDQMVSERGTCMSHDRVLYIAVLEGLLRIKLEDGTSAWTSNPPVFVPVNNIGHPRSLVFDPLSPQRYLYWVDKKQPRFLKIAPDAVGSKTTHISLEKYNCTNIYSIALDDLGRQLFVSCSDRTATSSIMAFKIRDADPPWHEAFLTFIGTVVSGDPISPLTHQPAHPTSIAIFPISGLLFYVDAGSGEKCHIIQCDIDGTNCATWLKEATPETTINADPSYLRIIYTLPSGVWSKDIADPTSDAQLHFQTKSSLHPLIAVPLPDGSILAAEGNQLIDTTTGTAISLPLHSQIAVLHTVSRGAERVSLSVCSRSDCSHLCKYDREAPKNYKCLCPLGFRESNHRSNVCEQPISCAAWQFACADGRTCVHKASRCDQVNDCPDESDESPAICRDTEQNFWLCDNGKESVPTQTLCDGSVNCSDGSDEENCRCSDRELDCGAWPRSGYDNRCVPRTRICDGIDDCPSKLDENPALCSLVVNPLEFPPNNPVGIYIALFCIIVFCLFAFLCWKCLKTPSRRRPMAQQLYQCNNGAEATILLPANVDSGMHVEVALRTFSVANSSSTYPALPPPHSSHYSSDNTSSIIHRVGVNEIPINKFYAPPPSAASMSTYGVVKQINNRPVQFTTTSRRRRRHKGNRGENDRTPPPQYSQVDDHSNTYGEAVSIDEPQHSRMGSSSHRSYRSFSGLPPGSPMIGGIASTTVAPSNSRIMSSDSGSKSQVWPRGRPRSPSTSSSSSVEENYKF